jgi:hypothetical protein
MNQNTYKRIMSFAWFAILLALIPFLVKKAVPDTDTFFLAATGRYIVENGIVPTINPFVIHEEFSIVIQQWGFDVMIYQLYNNFGNHGLFVYVLIAYTAMLVLLYKYIGLFTKNAWTRALVMLISGGIFLPFATARPTSFTILSILSLMYCVEQYTRTEKIKYLIPLPIISLIQINMHSSIWPMMFVLIVPYIFPHNVYNKTEMLPAIKQWFKKYRWLLLTMLLMIAAGLINPNGLNGILYVFKSYGNVASKCGIQELAPPMITQTMGILCIASIVALTVFVTINGKKIKDGLPSLYNEITRFYMAAGTIILACMHLRNSWYLIVGVMPMIAIMLDKLPAPPIAHKEQTNAKRLMKVIATFLIPCLLSVLLCYATPYAQLTGGDTEFAPREATKYLNTLDKKDIKLYTEFNNGAFMEWEGYQVYFDARPELFSIEINQKEDVLTEYMELQNGTLDYGKFLNKYNFTHLIVTNKTMQMYLKYSDNYKTIVEGNGYILFERVSTTTE